MGRSPSGYAWEVTPNSERGSVFRVFLDPASTATSMARTCRQITQDPIRPVYPDSRTDQVCELLLAAEDPDWLYTSLCSTGLQARLAYELHSSI